ncbi:transposase [Salmonella enterica subsp. enterica]|nr:transposase [Salmonella enterica]ECE0302922.1 transposase [Salmonella enterica subsp. enterica serovar Javiana]EAZ2570806.1 IS66 family insertion sequence element accessory protein TnpB [Salmonella enterica]EBA1652806.1 IS66 family insertion sequence element accessory protein TnpB [Salmonella enterica]EBC5529419.1 IS66 family insertion sequence element accessory protein TnpB [Salmonella enterica]
MITLPTGTRIWIIAGVTDMRCGFNGLASKVQNTLKDDPFSGHIFVFRGRSGKMVKILWADRDGLCLFSCWSGDNQLLLSLAVKTERLSPGP